MARSRKTGFVPYLLYPAVALAVLWQAAGAFTRCHDLLTAAMPQPAAPESAAGSTKPKRPASQSKPFSLKTDHQGHFRGTVWINNVAMPYLIDTGATRTSIPAKLAMAAGLPFGDSIQADTAGGQVIDRLTRINSLKIGNAEIRNLDASINQYLDEVLIGMNTLKYFHITQSGDTLTLAAVAKLGYGAGSVQVFNQSGKNDSLAADKPVKKPFRIKKTVTCDENKQCITAYSDH